MADRSSEDPAGGSPISDAEWEKFVRDAESEAHASAAPKEPSARARMVTERLRREEARGAQPEGWRTGPARREMDGRAGRRRRLWGFLGVTVAIAVAVVAVRPSLLPGDPFGTGTPFGTGEQDAVAESPLAAETAAPIAPPASTDPEVPTLDRPFAGSPALRWADGAAGVVLPEARAIGSLSKGQVELALRQTRKLLVDANLAPATLRGERPATALGLIEPQQTELIDLLNTSLRKPDKDHDPLLMFSRFDPDEVRSAGDVVKTRGRMTFEAGEQASVVVHADYTFVYPLVRAEKGSTEVARTIVRRVLDIELTDPAKYRVIPGKIAVVRYDQEIGNSACDVYDGYLHPQFDSDAPTGTQPTGPGVDPYDRSDTPDPDRAEGCGTVTRT